MGRQLNLEARAIIKEYSDLTAKEILRKLNETGKKCSIATVYNVLNELKGKVGATEADYQKEIPLPKPEVKYKIHSEPRKIMTDYEFSRSVEENKIIKNAKNDLEKRDERITIDMLTVAIANSIGEKKMGYDEAFRMALHVMNFFGYDDRIIDNVLEAEDRDVFYMLEDSGLLKTEREETTLYDGREWRINYWVFRRDKIIELIKGEKTEKPAEEPNVYDEISDVEWNEMMKERNGVRKEVGSEFPVEDSIAVY